MKARLWLALAVLGLFCALTAMNAWSAPASPQDGAQSQLQIIEKDVAARPLAKQSQGPPLNTPSAAASQSNTVEVTSEAPIIETARTASKTTIHVTLIPKDKADDKKSLDKLSAELQSLVTCSKKAGANRVTQCKLPTTEMVDVEVQLTSGDKTVMRLLEKTGLNIKSGSETTSVKGEIPVSQLETLASLEQVKSITKINDTAVMLTPEDQAAIRADLVR